MLRYALVVFLTLFAGCSGVPVQVDAPAGIEAMHPVDGADVAASFPGYAGQVFALGGDDAAHWFGVLTRGKGDGPEHLLVGISPHRAWSEPLTIEGANRKVTSLEVAGIWLGDLQKDGAPDLLLHLRTASRQDEGGRIHIRDVLQVYTLGKELRLAWSGTVGLKGASASGCKRLQYDYEATPTWVTDKVGGIRNLEVKTRTLLETCAPINKDCSGPVVCGMARTEDSSAFIWDPDLGAFRLEDTNEARFTIPDISFQ